MMLLTWICREKQEEEERKRLGIENKDSDEDVANGDPFKPLDLDTLKKKVGFGGFSFFF